MTNRVEIDLCPKSLFPKLTTFIDEYWRKGHRMVRDFELMRWQHYDEVKGVWNFVIALRDEDILGVLGFIDSRHFEREIQERSVVWLAIWKVRQDLPVAGLGLRLRSHVAKLHPQAMAAVGLNKTTLPLYLRFGFATGIMDHYYKINVGKDSLQITSGISKDDFISKQSQDWHSLIPLPEASLEGFLKKIKLPTNIFPAKGISYLQRRYVQHPVYQYQFFGVVDRDGGNCGVVVLRTVFHESSCALRIVDFVGDEAKLGGLDASFNDLLSKTGAEYIDILCHGVRGETLESSGFKKLNHEGSVIIPNYFEPFVRENIPIHFAYKNSQADIRPLFFKGDADQDRPN